MNQTQEVLRLLTGMHSDNRASKVRRLTVTSTPTFARQVLATHLPLFTAEHPDIELELVVVAPLLDAPATGADVEVRHGQGDAARAATLMQDVVLPMASPQYLRTCSSYLSSPAAIFDLTLLRTPYESWQPWLQAAGLQGREPERGPRFLDLGLAYEAAVQGQGVVLCRPSLIGEWLERKALQPVFDIQARPPGSYYLLQTSGRPGSDIFVNWLRTLCQNLARRNLLLARSHFE